MSLNLGQRPRILIIKTSSLGDIVHGMPVLRAIRDQWPEARVAWVVRPEWADLLQGHPYIDELVILWPGSLGRRMLALRRRLRRGHYDVALDLQGLFRSAWIAWLSGAPHRVGFARAREGAPLFYTLRVDVPVEQHAVARNLSLSRALGCSVPRVRFPLHVGREAWKGLEDRLQQARFQEPWVTLVPGARWEKKRWPAASFARLGLLLNRNLGMSIILAGSPEEAPLIQRVRESMGIPSLALTDLRLRELVALLSRSKVVVTNDSGPLHLAVAVGTPVVALFGPTDPARTGPYGDGHVVLVHPGLDCRPCFRRPCVHGRYRCLEEIPVDRVYQAVREILDRNL